jgi:hypothetical protein
MRRTLNLVVGLASLLLCLSGCARSGRAFNQVLVDFGLRPGPEPDTQLLEGDIFSRLSHVAEREIDRLNANPDNADVVFEEDPESALGLGKFYKTVKVYEKAYPLDVTRERARQVQRAETLRQRGYKARVEYRYRMYRGEKFPTRDEARDAAADMETEEAGREIYIYGFDGAGVWDGKPGRFDRRIEPAITSSGSTQSAVQGGNTDKIGLERLQIGGSIRVRAESVD